MQWYPALSAPLAVLIKGLTFSGCLATSHPITLADPDEGKSRVESILIMVVLPAPFGPRTPKTSPSLTFRSTRSRASTLPSLPLNSLRKSSTSTVDFASRKLINRETRLIPNKRTQTSHLTIRPACGVFSDNLPHGTMRKPVALGALKLIHRCKFF